MRLVLNFQQSFCLWLQVYAITPRRIDSIFSINRGKLIFLCYIILPSWYSDIHFAFCLEAKAEQIFLPVHTTILWYLWMNAQIWAPEKSPGIPFLYEELLLFLLLLMVECSRVKRNILDTIWLAWYGRVSVTAVDLLVSRREWQPFGDSWQWPPTSTDSDRDCH